MNMAVDTSGHHIRAASSSAIIRYTSAHSASITRASASSSLLNDVRSAAILPSFTPMAYEPISEADTTWPLRTTRSYAPHLN